MEQPKDYFAFISYKREDEKWAKWLADELEHYHLPTTLYGKELPKNLRPIFRDVDELCAGNLPEQIYNALTVSKNLIVVCSPRAAKSEWVDKEIKDFISLKDGKADNIYPFIIDGIPFSKDPDKECIPKVLRNLPKNEERLGGNINEQGGRNAAVVKIIAGMLGIGFDTLWQKYEREQRKKKNRLITATIIAFLCILSIAFTLFWQNQQIKHANWKMMENQARAVSEKAQFLIENHDSYLARMLLKEIYPLCIDDNSRPYVPEAEIAMRNAVINDEAVFPGHGSWGLACIIDFNADGKFLAVAYLDNTISVWDTYDGTCLRFIEIDIEKDRFTSMSLSPDGRYVAYTSNCLYIYNVETGEQKKYSLLAKSDINTIAYSPDGKCVAYVSSDGIIGVIDLATRKHIFHNVSTCSVNTVAFSKNGKHIVTSSDDGIVCVWNLETGNCSLSAAGHTDVVNQAIFSPDDTTVLSVCDSALYLWDSNSGILIRKTTINDEIAYASFSPDGKNILTAMADSTIRIWDAYNLSVSDSWKIKENIPTRIEYSPDGQHYAYTTFSYTGNIYLREIKKSVNNEKHYQKGFVSNAFLSPHGNNIVTIGYVKDSSIVQSRTNIWNDKKIMIINIWDDKMINCYHSFDLNLTNNCLTINPQNNNFIFGLDDGTIQFWDIDKKLLLKTVQAHKSGVNCISISPDGKYLISSPVNSSMLKVWDVSTMNCLDSIKCHTNKISNISFSPIGDMFATASEDGTIKLWDNTTRRCIHNLYGHTEKVLDMSFSPDGKQLASSSDDESIRLWNIKSGTCIRVLKGTPSRVHSVVYSPNGQYLLSAYRNGCICVWNTKTGFCLQTLRKDLNAMYSSSSAFFDSNGTHIIATSDDKDITIWDFPPLQELLNQTRERFKSRQLTPEERRMYFLE